MKKVPRKNASRGRCFAPWYHLNLSCANWSKCCKCTHDLNRTITGAAGRTYWQGIGNTTQRPPTGFVRYCPFFRLRSARQLRGVFTAGAAPFSTNQRLSVAASLRVLFLISVVLEIHDTIFPDGLSRGILQKIPVTPHASFPLLPCLQFPGKYGILTCKSLTHRPGAAMLPFLRRKGTFL